MNKQEIKEPTPEKRNWQVFEHIKNNPGATVLEIIKATGYTSILAAISDLRNKYGKAIETYYLPGSRVGHYRLIET